MIISQNSNDVYYAYTRGRFWRWDESARVWKESHLLAQKFGKAKAAEKHLTPEAFLTSDEFIPMDDYELPDQMLAALRDAKPCKNAPIDPVEEEPECAPAQNADAAVTTAENAVPTATAATPTISEIGADASASTPATSLQNCESAPAASAGGSSVSTAGAMQDKPLTTVPDAMRPAFDYSGLTDQTVEDLHFAENEYRHGKQMAERGLVHMGNAIAAAHDALCGVVAQCDNGEDGACRTMRKARNNQHSEDTFKSWCVSIGITKDTAYRLLQVSALLDGSSPRQQKILKELSPTLLYAVAKPSAPQELVEKVKNGDITTNKQYQEAMAQIKAEKDRAAAAETREEEARKAAHEYHEKYEEAAAMRATLLDQQGVYIADIDGLKKQNAELQQSYHDADEGRIAANLQRQKAEAERDRAEERAKNAEDALKKQPITAVIDEEEIDRRAAEKAWGLADARNAELAKDNANLKKQVAALRSRINDDAQADFEQANYCASLMRAAWDNSKASYSRLVGEDLESTFQTICGTLNSIMEEASLLCRQPPDYDGGDRDE
nr:MAG TPA: Protein of unknown function (DUF3102) [Caudoviricetes sp.]